MEDKLDEILQFYKDTYQVDKDIDEVRRELLSNDVEVNGDSFYCPIWMEEYDSYALLAGTKDKADMWVLKKIIKLIKTGATIHTMFNGNSKYLIGVFSRYDMQINKTNKDIVYITFNPKEG